MPFDASVRAYLRAYQNEYRAALHGGQHTAELSFRVPMHEMFRRIAHDLNPAGTFDIILEPRNQGRMGRPDWRMELYKMLPYLVTIIVLVAVSMRKKRENEPPAALGLAYFREERSFQSSTVFAVELCYYALLAATGRVFMPQGGKKHVV